MRRSWSTLALAGATALTCCVGVKSDEEPAAADIRPAKAQPASLTRTAMRLGKSSLVLSAFGVQGDGNNGAPGTVQPGVALWNGSTGSVLTQRQVNMPPNGNYNVATSNATHDAPQLVRTNAGGVFVFYGAASTYINYHPPQSWICEGRFACEPFKFAPVRDGSEMNVPGDLQKSTEYLMPSVGISELSYASIGDATIIAGQQQPTAPYGQSASQAYVSLHATPRGGYFDTVAGPWDFTSSHVPPGHGLQMITLASGDDAYFDFGIIRAGQGNVTLRIGSTSCRIPVFGNGDGAAAAQQIAASFDAACPQLSSRFGAMQVQYDPGLRVGGTLLPPAAVGIISKGGDPTTLPKDIFVQCDGGLGCGTARGENTVADVRGSGLHRHSLFGGILKLGPYIYYLMDIEQATGPWFGRGQSSSGLALVCFRTSAPSGANWTWTDCAGRRPFVVSPSVRPIQRLLSPGSYVIRPPAGGYRGEMTPYVYNWSMQAQREGGLPVIAAVSAAMFPDGNLMLVHGCQSRTRAFTGCFAILDTRSGETRVASTIDLPSGGGSLASFSVTNTPQGMQLAVLAGEGDKWGCGGGGACLMLYRYNAQSATWQRESVRVLGGDENAGFPGTITPEGGSFVVHYKRVRGDQVDLSSLLLPIP